MVTVSATNLAKRLGEFRLLAQHEPVAVTHHDRVTEVLISKRDYDEYQRLKGMAAKAYWAHEMDDETLAAVEAAEVDPRHEAEG